MLTTTALILLTATASVSPTAQIVSPTVTPTYTVRELEIYNKGWKNSVSNYSCIIQCDLLKNALESEKDIKKALLKIDPKIDPYNSGPADASYYKKEAADARKSIKENKCDCSKYKDK